MSSGLSTGPGAGELHCAALACHGYPVRTGNRPSFMDMDDSSSDGTDGSNLVFMTLECFLLDIFG